ncbi:hypothetical protein [Marinobacter sp.]|uniref:hypothetical protein n=1 Tax=Marinobacter sp. TaxID=50741 RepID=UPI0025801F9E|nr:hypothetical protein [Marinobacter sp.]|tara:strand:+ start:174 stop:743 length:570 start_codon:yes stop_codon:yes gene_type:complete
MSIFRGIAGALGGNSSNRVINSIIERLGNKSQPATEQINTQPGTSSVSETSSVAGSLPSKSFDRRFAGYTKPDTNKFDVIAPDYVPPSMQPKEFKALPDAIYTRGTVFADGTGSANAGKTAVRRFNNSQYVGDQSFDLRNFNQTNVPPPPSSLVQPFSQPVQRSANQIFGDLFARQNAVGAPMMFKINK